MSNKNFDDHGGGMLNKTIATIVLLLTYSLSSLLVAQGRNTSDSQEPIRDEAIIKSHNAQETSTVSTNLEESSSVRSDPDADMSYQAYLKHVKQRESNSTQVAYESVDKSNLPLHEPRWTDFLPILGQQARDEGYVLPLPFGVSSVLMVQEQPFEVKSIGVAFSDNESNVINGIVDNIITPENLKVSDQTLNFRFDAWIFPFWNIYGILGKTQGKAELDLRLSSDSELNIPTVLLAASGIGGGAFVSGPNRCTRLNLKYNGNAGGLTGACVVDLTANTLYPTQLDFHGDVYGYGTTVAGGYGDFFGMFDINYTEADVNIAKENTEQTVYSARIGWNGSMGYWSGQLWVGGMKQDIRQVLYIEVPDTPIAAIIDQEVSSPYNYLIGGSWNINQTWQIILESSFLFSDRQQFMMQGSYRF